MNPCRAFFCVFLLFTALCFGQDPDIYYLTWKDDPSTTMMVMWHTSDGNRETRVQFKELNSETWQTQEGTSKRFFDTSITIHRVELTGLEADTEYLYRINDGDIHQFRTLTDDLGKRPLDVVIGGDAYFDPEPFIQMNKEVASKNPDFVILAGDIAYAEGLRCALRTRYWKIERWEQFFRLWTKYMVTKEGRTIPIVPVIGNHDVKEGFDNPHKHDVIFYEVFAFPRSPYPYRTMNVANAITFYLLDSGHTYPVGGLQTEWLKKAFQDNKHSAYQIPVYHVPAYPSVTAFTHRGSTDIRKFWVPLFEKYGVRVSMEHDCHTFKRTFPIRDGMVDPENGIHYLGDGAWSVPPERPQRHWYLYKAAQTNCYWHLILDPSRAQIKAYDIDGNQIDALSIPANRTL